MNQINIPLLCLALLTCTLGCTGESSTQGNNVPLGPSSPPSASNAPPSGSNVPGDTTPDPSPNSTTGGQGTAVASTEGGTQTGTPNVKEIPQGNAVPQSALFECNPQEALSSPAQLRLLGRQEWRRNVGARAGSDAEENPFVALLSHEYATYSQGEEVNAGVLEAYLSVVGEAANPWLSEKGGQVGYGIKGLQGHEALACVHRPEVAQKCLDAFVPLLLERGVLHRKPTRAEVDQLMPYAKRHLGQAKDDPAQRKEAIRHVVSLAWLMVGALHRPELGEDAGDGRRLLTSHEFGQALAYALDGRAAGSLVTDGGLLRPPGFSSREEVHLAEIVRAIEEDRVRDSETIRELVYRYGGGEDEARVDLNLETDRHTSAIGEVIKAHSTEWLGLGVRDFFRQWLGYDAIETMQPRLQPSKTSRFEKDGRDVDRNYQHNINDDRRPQTEAWLVGQMDAVIARVVTGDKDVLRTLLTTDEFYVPSTKLELDAMKKMNRVYDLDGPIEPTRKDRWKVLKNRRGVLTHPAFLASHSGFEENDQAIIHRGKWIRERILCQGVPSLPSGIDASFREGSEGHSATRRHYEQLDFRRECPPAADGGAPTDCTEEEKVDASGKCAGCHRLMNPLGYPFEIYNHAGFVRQTDHGFKPSGGPYLQGKDPAKGPYEGGGSFLQAMPTGDPYLDDPDASLEKDVFVQDALELADLLSQSPHVKRCFVRQTFRYFAGRPETQADACVLSQMEQAYDKKGSFFEMLIALFSSDAFLFRHDLDHEEGGER